MMMKHNMKETSYSSGSYHYYYNTTSSMQQHHHSLYHFSKPPDAKTEEGLMAPRFIDFLGVGSSF